MRLWFLAATLVQMSVMAILGFSSNNALARYIPSMGNDKALHRSTFGLLTFLVYWIWHRSMTLNFILTGLVILTLAITSEIVQGFSPYRSFDAWDIIANLRGFLMGIFLAVLCDWLRRKYLQQTSKPLVVEELELINVRAE